jgi:hypothetical protein
MLLCAFIGTIVVVTFGWLDVSGVGAASGEMVRGFTADRVGVIVFFSLVSMASQPLQTVDNARM